MIPFSEELSKGVNNADISTEKKKNLKVVEKRPFYFGG